MIKKILLGSLIFFPAIASAHQHGCETVGASMESSLFDALSTDLKIDVSTIQRDKTEVEIIDVSPVSEIYANSLAEVDYSDALNNGKARLPLRDYSSSYYANDAKNITARYIYINNKGKKDIFIASSIMNKDECSVRFNGYITLSREF